MKSFDIKTKIFFGDQALDRLAEIPYQKVLIVTDPFIAQGSKRSVKASKRCSSTGRTRSWR